MGMNQEKNEPKWSPTGSTGVEFEKSDGGHSHSPRMPKMAGWLIKYSGGLVKDEKTANYVLVSFAVLVIILTFFVISQGGTGENFSSSPELPPSPDDLTF